MEKTDKIYIAGHRGLVGSALVLTLVLAKVKERLQPEQEAAYIDQLRHLPVAVHRVLELESEIKAWAQRFADKHHALFLGRGRHYPTSTSRATLPSR